MAESCGCRAVEDASLRDTDEVALCPLHAAAPELLEALREAVEQLDGFFIAVPSNWSAAIAKAEGRANA